MIRTFKALGLALIAILAMSAFMASAAQAVQGKFTNTHAKNLTATQDDEKEGKLTTETGVQKLTMTSGVLSCDEFHADITGLAVTSELTEITAQNIKYNDTGLTTCKGPFSTKPTIEMNGCDYLFTAGERLGTSDLTAQLHLVCPVGKQITITVPFCQIHFPDQRPTGHIVFKNVPTPNQQRTHITGEATLTGIQYQGTELCSSATTGTYTGNITVKGYKEAPHNATQEESIHVH
jgi:hypothetical protein